VAGFTACVYRRFAPDTDPDAIAEATALLTGQDYTLAELCWAARRMPFDADVAAAIEHKTQNPFWILAATDRIIQTSRRVRRALVRVVDGFEKRQLLQLSPDLRDADFHICKFDHGDQPLYRFAPSANRSAEAQEALKNLLAE